MEVTPSLINGFPFLREGKLSWKLTIRVILKLSLFLFGEHSAVPGIGKREKEREEIGDGKKNVELILNILKLSK